MPPEARSSPLLSPLGRGLLAAALGATLVVLLLNARVNAQFQRASFPDEMDRYYLPPPEYLRVASLGYREAAADLVWVATIQHGSDRRVVAGGRFPWLEQYLDATLALNPYLLKVYLWADGTLTYGRGRMRNRDWRRTIHYLERGHRIFPRNWEMLFKLACAYTEMRTKDERQRSRWRRRAADYLWKAHLVGGGPPWLGSLAARYWSEEGQWLLAYQRALEEFRTTEDPRVKHEMADRLADLLSRTAGGHSLVAQFSRQTLPTLGNPAAAGLFLVGEILLHKQVYTESDRQVREMEAERQVFDDAHARCLPYGSGDLFVILGPCREPASDGGVPALPAGPRPTPLRAAPRR